MGVSRGNIQAPLCSWGLGDSLVAIGAYRQVPLPPRISPISTLNSLQIEPKPSQHDRDGDEAYAQADTALVAFNHRVLTCLLVRGGDLQSSLDILIHQGRLEAMDGDAGFGQRILCLILGQTGFADFHSGGLSDPQSLIRILNAAVELRQTALNRCPRLITPIPGLMAPHADTLRTGAEHRVRWKMDAMVGVAHDTSRQSDCLEGLVVRTLLIHLRLKCMAVRAHILDLIHSGRHRAMVSMTSRAGWCA